MLFGARCNITTNTTVSGSLCSGLGNGDTMYITATLTMNADFTSYSSTDIVVVVDGTSGFINWTLPRDFSIGSGGKLVLLNGGSLTNNGAAQCSANYRFLVGGVKKASCNGGSADFSFTQVNTAGGFDANGTLPVDLIRFEAVLKGKTATLNWVTASEINNSHFNIERSIDGLEFEVIGMVLGNGTSQEVLQYSFTDVSVPRNAAKLFYRLNQFDYDGQSEYSRVIRVDKESSDKVSIYPNPTNGELFVNLLQAAENEYIIEVRNLEGQLLFSETDDENKGKIKLDLSEFTSGIYIVSVSADKSIQYFRLIKN